MTIGKKMGLGFGILLALVATLAIVILLQLVNIHRQFSFVIQHNAPVIANARHLLTLVVDMETGQSVRFFDKVVTQTNTRGLPRVCPSILRRP